MLLTEDRKALLTTVGYGTWSEQDEILDHDARIKLVAGGERAGKSFLGALSIISRLDEFESGIYVGWLLGITRGLVLSGTICRKSFVSWGF